MKTAPYASLEESLAAIQPDTRSPAEKRLDEMLDERNANEMGADHVGILRQIAVELMAEQAEAVPPGYVLLPMEPTLEMLLSARDWSATKYGKPIGDDAAKGCWGAMISAAIAQQKGRL